METDAVPSHGYSNHQMAYKSYVCDVSQPPLLVLKSCVSYEKMGSVASLGARYVGLWEQNSLGRAKLRKDMAMSFSLQ